MTAYGHDERAPINSATKNGTLKTRHRALRLLPGVMLVCGGLLVLNTSGLVHDAYALDSATPEAADAMAPAPAPANRDFSDGDGEIASAAEVDVLTSLGKRRNELDARESDIKMQTNILAATEARIDSKIVQLKALQTQINGLLVQRDKVQNDQIASLVKTYSGMKPVSAAAIFSTLPDPVLVPVAQAMKADVLGDILAKMSPDAAQKLTVKLANRLTLPDTTGPLGAAMAPVAPITSAAPGQKTSAITPPTQTAAATPTPPPNAAIPVPSAAAPAATAPAAKTPTASAAPATPPAAPTATPPATPPTTPKAGG